MGHSKNLWIVAIVFACLGLLPGCGPEFNVGDRIIVHGKANGLWCCAKTESELNQMHQSIDDDDLGRLFETRDSRRQKLNDRPADIVVRRNHGSYIQIDHDGFVGYIDTRRVKVELSTPESFAKLNAELKRIYKEEQASLDLENRGDDAKPQTNVKMEKPKAAK